MATLIASPIPEPRIDWRDLDGTRKRLAAWSKRIAEYSRSETRKSDEAIGRTVKFSIADGYAEYVVYDTSPLHLIHVPESYDISAAHMRGLKLADIRALVEYDKRLEAMFDSHEAYYANLPVGTVVHYDNGFAQFVRCVRVDGPVGKRLRPIALVGNWREYDLPRRNPDGSVYLGSHAKWIAEGECFEPNYGSIWERYDAKGREWSMRGLTPEGNAHLNEIGRARFAELRYQAPFDPTTAEAIDLTPPALDREQEELAVYVQRFQHIASLVNETPRTLDEARATYRIVQALVARDYNA